VRRRKAYMSTIQRAFMMQQKLVFSGALFSENALERLA